MNINLGGTPPPTSDKVVSENLTRVAPGERLPGDLPSRSESPQQIASEKLIAQVIASRRDGLAQLRTLANNQQLNLQSNQRLQPGQLVLIESRQTAGRTEVSLLSQPRLLTEQILRLLVPHNGNLKTKLANVLQLPSVTDLAKPGASNQTVSADSINANLRGANAPLATPKPLTSGNQGLTSPTQNTSSQGSGLLQKLAHLLNPQTAQIQRSVANSNVSQGSDPAAITAKSGLAHQKASPQDLLLRLPTTGQLREPGQVAHLLQPGQLPSLLKLVMPLLQANLARVPVNAEQKQQRDAQTTALTQLAARILLGALRAPNTGNEVEVSRAEWLSRFDSSIDSLQVELSVIKDNLHDREQKEEEHAAQGAEKVRQWRVRLAFEFEELGLITAFVLLTANEKLEVQFWTERDSTRTKLEQYRQRFNQRLDTVLGAFGITQMEVGVYEGTPPPARQPISSHLIDETA